MTEWLVQNWYYLVFILVLIVVAIYGCTQGKAKEWLKWAVVLAEKRLGTGTGQLKLHMVYDMFVEKFPMLAVILPFSVFSKWVDLALEWMEAQLSDSTKVKMFIER